MLYSAGLIKKEEERYVPTFPVITHESGQQLYQLSITIGNDIVSLIKLNANRIQQETFKIPALHHFEFADLSLFIMSDVLLDFVQIDYVEQLFLKSDRPLRNGKNYYYGLLEKHADQQLEPFGIYGNHCVPIGSTYYCIYGNNRYNQPLLPLFSKEQVCTLFGPELSENKAEIPTIIDHIIQSSSGNGSIDSEIRKGLEQLHLWKNGKLMIPVLTNEEYQALHRIAKLITADMIKLFEDYRSMLFQAYRASPFATETSFEEYFIWYYHRIERHTIAFFRMDSLILYCWNHKIRPLLLPNQRTAIQRPFFTCEFVSYITGIIPITSLRNWSRTSSAVSMTSSCDNG